MPIILNPIVLDKKIKNARNRNKHGGCTKLFWKHWKDNKDRFDNMLDETNIPGSLMNIHEIARIEIGTENVPHDWAIEKEYKIDLPNSGWKYLGEPFFINRENNIYEKFIEETGENILWKGNPLYLK